MPNLCWNRHCKDMQAALAYSFLVMTDGRVGSAIEREFITEERNRIKFRSMGRFIETQTYDDVSDLDTESPLIDENNKLNKDKSSELEQKHLNDNSDTTSIHSCSSRKSFKFKSCTICLGDFIKGEKVSVVPVCDHTFHKECLANWLEKRFRCPNCNLDIETSMLRQQD